MRRFLILMASLAAVLVTLPASAQPRYRYYPRGYYSSYAEELPNSQWRQGLPFDRYRSNEPSYLRFQDEATTGDTRR